MSTRKQQALSPEVKAVLRAWVASGGPQRIRVALERQLPRVLQFLSDLRVYGWDEAERRHPWACGLLEEVERRRASDQA